MSSPRSAFVSTSKFIHPKISLDCINSTEINRYYNVDIETKTYNHNSQGCGRNVSSLESRSTKSIASFINDRADTTIKTCSKNFEMFHNPYAPLPSFAYAKIDSADGLVYEVIYHRCVPFY